jgi:cell wall-associated NlpC family hydrolase
VTLTSVSLFGGAVTADSVSGTAGRGTVTGLKVEGMDVSLGPGQMVAVGDWAQVTLARKVGRARALLVLNLLAQHGPLPVGTVVAVGFEAAPQPVAKPKPTPQPTHPQADGQAPPTVENSGKTGNAAQTRATKKRRQLQPQRPPPDYPAAPSPFTGGGRFTDAVRDNPVVAIALQYLGVPYQWGGADPTTGFDCSGLVQYVFAQLNVPLTHYAAAQWHAPDSVWVAPNRLQPGDLVFFTGSDGTRKAPGHVGIYIDDGYIVDAPHTGALVRIDSLDEPKLANQYVGARRIDPQSIDTRHLLHAAKPGAPAIFHLGFSQPSLLGAVGQPFGVAAIGAATLRNESHGYWIWGGSAFGGLLLMLCAAWILARRRRPPNAGPSGEAST